MTGSFSVSVSWFLVDEERNKNRSYNHNAKNVRPKHFVVLLKKSIERVAYPHPEPEENHEKRKPLGAFFFKYKTKLVGIAENDNKNR